MLIKIGITAPPVFIPTIQLPVLKRAIFEKVTPTTSSIIPEPNRNEPITITIASSSEKPIYLNEFVIIE
jgi:hypothetical protein